ncbi:MAG: hypothetical protein WA777_20805 [Rhodanobacter sp.]
MSFLRPMLGGVLLCLVGLPAGVFASGAPGSAAAPLPATNQQVPATSPVNIDGLGQPVSVDTLGHYSGGTNVQNNQAITGAVTGNSATQVVTGTNSISTNSFSGASGLPTVIQNTGNNVLIQNGVIVNVQFKQ